MKNGIGRVIKNITVSYYWRKKHEQLRKDIKNIGDDRFFSRTFTPEEWACFYSIILVQNDFNLEAIRDDKIVISIMEEYANSGMEILINDLLINFINNENEPKIERTKATHELPKLFISYLYEKAIDI